MKEITFIVRSKSDQYIRNIRRDNGYETDLDDYSSRSSGPFICAEERARDRLANETTRDVKKIGGRGLCPQRVYLVSRSILMIVNGEHTRSAIDEHNLYGDIDDWANWINSGAITIDHVFNPMTSYFRGPVVRACKTAGV